MRIVAELATFLPHAIIGLSPMRADVVGTLAEHLLRLAIELFVPANEM